MALVMHDVLSRFEGSRDGLSGKGCSWRISRAGELADTLACVLSVTRSWV